MSTKLSLLSFVFSIGVGVLEKIYFKILNFNNLYNRLRINIITLVLSLNIESDIDLTRITKMNLEIQRRYVDELYP